MAQPETDDAAGLGALEPVTRQRAQLRTRIADVAWTALCVILLFWGIWSAVGVAGGVSAWAYSAVAWVLLAMALVTRAVAARSRTRI
ncbi:hypothetical protein [Streptomyces sp. NPDC058308]|uniref:hypothetical protein n=1 Tax=Streptomyces sp. NPDC058308 TaxID=3346440 RepID=UPI0036EBF558